MSAPTVNVGLSQAFAWQTQAGNIVTTPLAAGLVIGGEMERDYDTKLHIGVGSQYSHRSGLNQYGGSLKFRATSDSKALLQAGVKALGGSLTAIQFQDGDTQEFYKWQNGKIHKLKWSCGGIEEPLECELALMALSAASATYAGIPVLSSGIFQGVDLVLTVNGTDFGAHKVSGEVDNGLKVGSHFGSKTAGTVRDPTWLVEGPDKHRITVETYMPVTAFASNGTDSPALNVGLIAAFTFGSATLTFTYSNLAFVRPSGRAAKVPEDTVSRKYTLSGPPGCLGIT